MIVYSTDEIPKGFDAGGKGNNLLKLVKSGYNVPRFCILPPDEVITSNAFKSKKGPSHNLPEKEPVTKFVEAAISSFFNNPLVQPVEAWAVRSSAPVEDGSQHSFAGQFETVLNVTINELAEAIIKVRNSGNSDRVKAYSKNPEAEIRLSVVIQEMLEPDISGVAFGANPINGNRNEVLISAVYGLGEGLVSGYLDADNYAVSSGIIKKTIANKNEKIVKDPLGKGTAIIPVPDPLQQLPCLSDQQCYEIETLLKKLEADFNYPQDIEWSYVKGELFLLQTRPITTLTANVNQGTRVVWDNSNIIESYPGTVSPLTFSFILEVYERAYREFLGLLGVEENVINANRAELAEMLGLIRGKVYYNLRSWYQLLSLLPGYKLNASFMETMMGVKERFELPPGKPVSKFKEYLRILKVSFRMIKQYRRLPAETVKFKALLKETISHYSALDFASMDLRELYKSYRDFEDKLLLQWKPPLVNDFFAMIFFGFLKKKSAEWIQSSNPNIHNDLLCGSEDIISTEPIKESLAISGRIMMNEQLKSLFLNASSAEISVALNSSEFREIDELIKKYIRVYGYRCIGELKLESISYTDQPLLFIELLQSYVKAGLGSKSLDRGQDFGLRQKAEKEVRLKLRDRKLKRWLFNYLVNNTRRLVSNRENLRFERTRGFGIVRLHFASMGKWMHKNGFIEEPRDIFFLMKQEIDTLSIKNKPDEELRKLISERKLRYSTYENETLPERIETFGDVSDYIPEETIPAGISETNRLSGTGCCPGKVNDQVTLMRSHSDPVPPGGSIIVATSTDPGWVTIFPYASGIIVERGSLLSHTAIVAREMGIPCIVSVPGLMNSLKTGDTILMDGSSGEILILERFSADGKS